MEWGRTIIWTSRSGSVSSGAVVVPVFQSVKLRAWKKSETIRLGDLAVSPLRRLDQRGKNIGCNVFKSLFFAFTFHPSFSWPRLRPTLLVVNVILVNVDKEVSSPFKIIPDKEEGTSEDEEDHQTPKLCYFGGHGTWLPLAVPRGGLGWRHRQRR